MNIGSARRPSGVCETEKRKGRHDIIRDIDREIIDGVQKYQGKGVKICRKTLAEQLDISEQTMSKRTRELVDYGELIEEQGRDGHARPLYL
jgi:predicted transcriptional regulator